MLTSEVRVINKMQTPYPLNSSKVDRKRPNETLKKHDKKKFVSRIMSPTYCPGRGVPEVVRRQTFHMQFGVWPTSSTYSLSDDDDGDDDIFDMRPTSQTFARPAALYLHQNAKMHGVPSESVKVLSNLLTPAWEMHDGRMTQVRYGESEKATHNAGTLHVAYVNTEDHWHAQGMTNLQSLDEKTLSTICQNQYIYLTIGFSHPLFLMNSCMVSGIECPFLEKTVFNDNEDFEPPTERNEANRAITELMKGNSFVPGPNVVADWFPELKTEVELVMKKISALPEHEELSRQYRHSSNKNIKIASAVFLAEQKQHLDRLFRFLLYKGVVQDGNFVLRRDGIMVSKTSANEIRMDENFFELASEHVGTPHTVLVHIDVGIKKFVDVYALPSSEVLTNVEESHYLVEHGDYRAVSDIIAARCKSLQLVVRSHGRLYSRLEGSLVFTEGEEGVKGTIIEMMERAVVVNTTSSDGRVEPYSSTNDKMMHLVNLVLHDECLTDNTFDTPRLKMMKTLLESGNPDDRIWLSEIRTAVREAGMTDLSDIEIIEYVKMISPLAKVPPYRPSGKKLGIPKQSEGFNCLRLRPKGTTCES